MFLFLLKNLYPYPRIGVFLEIAYPCIRYVSYPIHVPVSVHPRCIAHHPAHNFFRTMGHFFHLKTRQLLTSATSGTWWPAQSYRENRNILLELIVRKLNEQQVVNSYHLLVQNTNSIISK